MSRFILLLLLQTLMAYTGENYCTFFSPLYQILARNIERYRSVANLTLHCLLTVRHNSFPGTLSQNGYSLYWLPQRELGNSVREGSDTPETQITLTTLVSYTFWMNHRVSCYQQRTQQRLVIVTA